MTATATRPARKRRGAQGWMPNQHGAWAMVTVPWLLGFVLALRDGGDIASGLMLLACWLTGYFAFFATSQWLRSRLKPRYLPAVATYAIATVVLGLGALALRPQWWTWAAVFAPLVGTSLWLAWRRAERSLRSGAATVAAASLLPLVLGSDALWPWTVAPALLGVALVCFAYFFGTVLYVKTLIRKRGSRGWVVASVVWHVGCVLGTYFLPEAMPRGLLAGFFVVMALRALVVPGLGPLRGRNVTAAAAGIGEFVATGALVAVLLCS